MFKPEILATWFLVFMFYSVAGWVMEIIVTWFQYRKFVNRGFLVGPVCPIYGTGAVILTYLMRGVESPLAIFCVWLVGGSVIEYAASYLMEKIFRVRWWDYTKNGFNLNGRICLWSAMTFGIGGVVILKFVNPAIFGLISSLPSVITISLALVLAVLLALDIALSLWLMLGVRITVGAVERDATEEISERVHEILMGKGKLNRRLVKAFPNKKVSNRQKSKKCQSAKKRKTA